MSPIKHFYLWLLFIIIQFLVFVFYLSPQDIYDTVNMEREQIVKVMGEDAKNMIVEDSNNAMKGAFANHGIIEGSYDLFIPGGYENKDDAEGAFASVRDTIEVFWATIYQSLQRGLIMLYWMPYLLIIIIPAIADGLVKRQIKIHEMGWSSPVSYNVAIHLVIASLSIPLLYLTLPVNPSIWLVPLWMVLIAYAISRVVSNIQKRL